MTELTNKPSKTFQLLLILASFVIIIAGMKAAEAIVVPFLLAAFLAIITSPPFIWMQKKGVPKVLALLFIIVAFLSVLFLIGVLIGTSVNDFTSNLPFYQEKLTNQTQALISWLVEKNYVKPDFQLTKVINPGCCFECCCQCFESDKWHIRRWFPDIIHCNFYVT